MTRFKTVTSCLLLVILIPLLGMAQAASGEDRENVSGPDVAVNEPTYIIQPNDILEVFVWREPELSRKVLVRPDGRISFPLVQDMHAAGMTPVELKEGIEAQLKEFIEAPSVTVIVDTIQHYKVYVIGKVQRPGNYVIEKPVTVLQALTLAGGFQEFADKSKISVIRSEEDQHTIFAFDFDGVIKGKVADQNIFLRSGDVVVVP